MRRVDKEALDREAHNGEVILDSLFVLEKTMKYFFMQAELGAHGGKNKEIVDRDYLNAAAIAEKVAPYRHARLSAVTIAGDPNATKELGDDASLEELKRIVEFHLERITPVLDLQVLPLNGNGTEPGDGIADCDAPQGRAGNDAGAPQGQRRASNHRGGIRYRHD